MLYLLLINFKLLYIYKYTYCMLYLLLINFKLLYIYKNIYSGPAWKPPKGEVVSRFMTFIYLFIYL